MKATNYYIYDFMDFDPALSRHEALWKAYAPTKMEEHDGDILVTMPFQKQLEQDDMAPDTAVAPRIHTLRIRGYEHNILRLFITMNGDGMTDDQRNGSRRQDRRSGGEPAADRI